MKSKKFWTLFGLGALATSAIAATSIIATSCKSTETINKIVDYSSGLELTVNEKDTDGKQSVTYVPRKSANDPTQPIFEATVDEQGLVYKDDGQTEIIAYLPSLAAQNFNVITIPTSVSRIYGSWIKDTPESEAKFHSVFENTNTDSKIKLVFATTDKDGANASSAYTTVYPTAFYGSNFGEITLPASTKTISENAFVNSTGTINFAANSAYKEVKRGSFNGSKFSTINLPNVTKIEIGAFAGLTTTTKIDLSKSSITTIPNALFANCSALTSVELPSSATSIGSFAFANCSALTSVSTTSTSAIKTISDSAFVNCKSLSFDFSKFPSIDSVGVASFANAATNTSAQIKLGSTTNPVAIGNYAFYGADVDMNNSKIKSVGTSSFANATISNFPKVDFTVGVAAFSQSTIKTSTLDQQRNILGRSNLVSSKVTTDINLDLSGYKENSFNALSFDFKTPITQLTLPNTNSYSFSSNSAFNFSNTVDLSGGKDVTITEITSFIKAFPNTTPTLSTTGDKKINLKTGTNLIDVIEAVKAERPQAGITRETATTLDLNGEKNTAITIADTENYSEINTLNLSPKITQFTGRDKTTGVFSYTKVKAINIGSATDKLESTTTPLASPQSRSIFGTAGTNALADSARDATASPAPSATLAALINLFVATTSTTPSVDNSTVLNGWTAKADKAGATSTAASASQSSSIFGTSRTKALPASANTADAVSASAGRADATPASYTKDMNGITWTYTWDATNQLGTFSATITGGAYKNTYPKQTKDDQTPTSSYLSFDDNSKDSVTVTIFTSITSDQLTTS